jgi:uncharacterized membrane protein YccC
MTAEFGRATTAWLRDLANICKAILRALSDWGRTDGIVWVYVLKALIACFLALGVSMKLDLPQPRTAMTTVFVVMQPRSGMVFAKSFYRACGTVVGLVVMLTAIGLFAQQPELFLICTASWVGICTAGATWRRGFAAYGFALSGYTVALIGIPASQHPDAAFMTALTRVAEIVVGIVCSGVVSALLLPERSGEQMRTTVRVRFTSFFNYASSMLSSVVEREKADALNEKFVSDIVGFEAVRNVAIFEGAEVRVRNGRLSRLNSEFMSASTRFHLLIQLVKRIRSEGDELTTKTLDRYLIELEELLRESALRVHSAIEAAGVIPSLERYKSELPNKIATARARLALQDGSRLIDFDTSSELLYRFVDELLAYTSTYASLAVFTHERERWVEHYEAKTNAVAACISGLRATVVMTVFGAFWLATAWPSGTTFTLNTSTVCAMAAWTFNPGRVAFQMTLGTILSSALGFILSFYVYPRIDGFPMLCVALTPFVVIGVWMTTRPRLAAYGVGYCIYLCYLAGPDNVTHYDPSGFINDAIALVLSMLLAAIGFAILVPPGSQWLRDRLLSDLRRQVLLASRGNLVGLRVAFESGVRDLAFQLNATASTSVNAKSMTMAWMFCVLEVGSAVIDLRTELTTLTNRKSCGDLIAGLRETCLTLGRTFEKPSLNGVRSARRVTTAAIESVGLAMAKADPASESLNELQRILSNLHFIRTALLDPQSPINDCFKESSQRTSDHLGASDAA